MAETYRSGGSHLDTIERPFYIALIHAKQHSPRPFSAHAISVGSDDPGIEFSPRRSGAISLAVHVVRPPQRRRLPTIQSLASWQGSTPDRAKFPAAFFGSPRSARCDSGATTVIRAHTSDPNPRRRHPGAAGTQEDEE